MLATILVDPERFWRRVSKSDSCWVWTGAKMAGYGSFRLGFEPIDEPPQRLLASARENGVEEKVLLMTEGRPVVL